MVDSAEKIVGPIKDIDREEELERKAVYLGAIVKYTLRLRNTEGPALIIWLRTVRLYIIHYMKSSGISLYIH